MAIQSIFDGFGPFFYILWGPGWVGSSKRSWGHRDGAGLESLLGTYTSIFGYLDSLASL